MEEENRLKKIKYTVERRFQDAQMRNYIFPRKFTEYVETVENSLNQISVYNLNAQNEGRDTSQISRQRPNVTEQSPSPTQTDLKRVTSYKSLDQTQSATGPKYMLKAGNQQRSMVTKLLNANSENAARINYMKVKSQISDVQTPRDLHNRQSKSPTFHQAPQTAKSKETQGSKYFFGNPKPNVQENNLYKYEFSNQLKYLKQQDKQLQESIAQLFQKYNTIKSGRSTARNLTSKPFNLKLKINTDTSDNQIKKTASMSPRALVFNKEKSSISTYVPHIDNQGLNKPRGLNTIHKGYSYEPAKFQQTIQLMRPKDFAQK